MTTIEKYAILKEQTVAFYIKEVGDAVENSTLKQIAQELGISVSTVSRAINGKSVVKKETRKRVLELAQKYAYTPNEVARALKNASTHTVAVVLPDISETFFGKIVKELDQELSAHGYMLILADTHENPKKERKLLDMLFTRRVDALVLATVDPEGSSVKKFTDRGIPVVFIDNLPALAGVDAIAIDNRQASRIAAEHLVGRGHRRIAAVFGSLEETTGRERFEGFCDALAERDIPVDSSLITFGDFKRPSGYEAMKRLLENREMHPFSAVYVTSEQMSYGALQAIGEAGLSIPKDLSFIGFDIPAPDAPAERRITSVRQPEALIGRKVGEQLLLRLSSLAAAKTEAPEAFLQEGDTVAELL